MDVVTAEEMRKFDRETIERLGIPSIASDGERRTGYYSLLKGMREAGLDR